MRYTGKLCQAINRLFLECIYPVYLRYKDLGLNAPLVLLQPPWSRVPPARRLLHHLLCVPDRSHQYDIGHLSWIHSCLLFRCSHLLLQARLLHLRRLQLSCQSQLYHLYSHSHPLRVVSKKISPMHSLLSDIRKFLRHLMKLN